MELMNEGQKLTLLWRLVAATQKGSLEWRKLGAEEFFFRTEVGRFSYVIASRDRDDYAPFDFFVYRRATVRSSETSSLLDTWEMDRAEASLSDALTSLYTEVSRKVNGLDTAVTEMFEDLSRVDGGSANPDVPAVDPKDPWGDTPF